MIAKLQVAEQAWKTDVEGLNQRRARVQEHHLKPPTEIHSHPKAPCREQAARQGAIMWRGCGEEESGGHEHDGPQMPFVGGKAGPQAAARKLDETRRRMAREQRGAGSSLVGMETPYYKTIY